MSLSNLANLGEFISSIAVLASLIYLAVQDRRSGQMTGGSDTNSKMHPVSDRLRAPIIFAFFKNDTRN